MDLYSTLCEKHL